MQELTKRSHSPDASPDALIHGGHARLGPDRRRFEICADLATPKLAIPAILAAVAKVMISMPDELLARIDAQVKSEHATRSEFLRRLAERELAQEQRQRRKRIEELLDAATGNFGGDGAKLIREDRESH